MIKNAQDAVFKYENDVTSGKLEELRLFVPKDVANKFRQVAKKSRMTPHELLEEMVEIYRRTVEVTASFVLSPCRSLIKT